MKSHRATSFIVAALNAHTWVVGYSRALIPGAILRTKNAALDYVSALAKAAGFRKVHVVISGDSPGRGTKSPIGAFNS